LAVGFQRVMTLSSRKSRRLH